MSNQPNIILICVDQWRGDCLSIAGHPVVHTPWLDKLAIEGARIDRAYAACPTCIPARASLYTGLTQRSHGRIGYQDGVPWNYPVTIASEFTRHGYQTQAVGKLHVYPERSQMGFQNVLLHDGFLHYARGHNPEMGRVDDYMPWLREKLGEPHADYFDHGVNCNSNVARPWDKEESLHPTNWVVTQSLEFLRRRDTRKPFFLYMSFHRPHPPYDPPAWAFEQYLDEEMPDPPVGDWVGTFEHYANRFQPESQVSSIGPRRLRRARAGYYGHMTHIDHQLNRFIECMADFRPGPTYICFTSDHGEMMGDHHMFRKGMPYEGAARVPLLLRGPRDSGIRAGGVHQQLIELRDILPTLLECAALPVPDCVEGKSFLPIARGQHPDTWRDYLHGEHISFGQSVQFIVAQPLKYVWLSATGQEQLFDLQSDPQELHNLATQPERANELSRMRGLLISELSGREEGFTDGDQMIAGRPVGPVLQSVLGTARQA